MEKTHKAPTPGIDPYFSFTLDQLASVQFPVGKLLDVGCATGINASYAAERGWAVTGVDPVLYITNQSKKNVRYVKGSLPQLPFSDGSFDLVTCTNVLPLLSVAIRRKSIRELMRIVRPGGAIALSCIDREDDANRGGYWNPSSLRLPFDEALWDVSVIIEPVKPSGEETIVRSLHSVLAFRP